VTTYKDGIDEIAADGTLPLEMGRGQRALHYHLFALAPLVTMAELAAANGEDRCRHRCRRLRLQCSRRCPIRDTCIPRCRPMCS